MAVGSGFGSSKDRVESVLGPCGVVAVGFGQVAEGASQPDDRDRGIAQTSEVARHMTHPSPTTVFVVSEVADIMPAVLDLPVVADQAQQLVGPRGVGAERSQAKNGFMTDRAGFDDLAGPLNANRLLAFREVAITVPFCVGDVKDGTPACLDATMTLKLLLNSQL